VVLVMSVYAVIQPLRADPRQTTKLKQFWYPIETNSYARLEGVNCANEYACRLNSVAARNVGDQQEVWAVGNVGLVVRRNPGQRHWEQLAIQVKPTVDSAPPAPAAAPATKPVSPTGSRAPKPVSSISVPSLLGYTLDLAQQIASKLGLQVSVQYAKGSEPRPNAPPAANLRVVQQSPAAGTSVPPRTSIIVMLGHSSSAAMPVGSARPSRLRCRIEEEASSPRKARSQSAAEEQWRTDTGCDQSSAFRR
jgi:hypothetical protein